MEKLWLTVELLPKPLRGVSGVALPTADTRPAIDKTGVKGERLAYGDDVPEALAYAIDPNWRGELPRTYLFDARGGVKAVSGTIDAAGFRTALKLK